MKLAGLQKTTLIDFPEKVACTVFTQGCNLRCPYCHNPELISCDSNQDDLLAEGDFFSFLESRRGLLDGVCITGGEPTIQPDLVDFAARIRELGFLVKLDTNGTRPQAFATLLDRGLLDFIAMDVKTSPEGYVRDLGYAGKMGRITESIAIIKESGVEYEFRTTVVPDLVGETELFAIGRMIASGGHAGWYALQNFRSGKVLSERMKNRKGYPPQELGRFREIMESFAETVEIRD
ncbi:MAG: anaerobic ribonucleoside-triphosphate reductase activating protein [Thermovirgaceae bacterium]